MMYKQEDKIPSRTEQTSLSLSLTFAPPAIASSGRPGLRLQACKSWVERAFHFAQSGRGVRV